MTWECWSSRAAMIFLTTVTVCIEGQKKVKKENVGKTTVLNIGV